jgi:hypothetical protein
VQGRKSDASATRTPACVHALFKRRHGTASLSLHQSVLHEGIGKAVEKAQHVRVVAVAGLLQQLADALALIKPVKGKLGAGNSGGQIRTADLRVLRGLLAPFVDLLLPLEALACLMFAQALGIGVSLRVGLMRLGGIFRTSGSLWRCGGRGCTACSSIALVCAGKAGRRGKGVFGSGGSLRRCRDHERRSPWFAAVWANARGLPVA